MPGDARHVLVIEDDAETADQLVDCLKSSGYEVDLAVDGEDGLRRALAADYVVMTVECPTCKTKQKIHVAVTVGGAHTGDQTIPCINCTNHFKVTVSDKILRGPFPA